MLNAGQKKFLGGLEEGWEPIKTEWEQAGRWCTLREYCFHLSRRLEYVSIIWFLIGSILGVSIEHVVTMFKAEREHV